MTRILSALAVALLTTARAQAADATPADAAAPAMPNVEPAPSPAAPPGPEKKEKKKDEPGEGVKFAIGERSQISISGRAWASVENVRADAGSAGGAAEVQPRMRLHNNSSYLRIEGESDLGAGIHALAQIEAEFGIDGENGTPFSGTRNTGVGLETPAGKIIVGRWDSPSKQTTIGLDPFGGTGILGYYNVFGQQQTSAGGQGANRWDRRLNNSVSYWSPSFAGVKLLGAVAFGEATSSTSSGATPVTSDVTPLVLNGALHYKAGPLFAGVSYEWRQDCGNPDADAPAGASCSVAALGSAGTQPRGKDQAFRAGVGFDNKATFTKLAAAFERISLTADAAGALPEKTLQRNVYWGTITQGLGSSKHQLIGAFGYAADVTGAGVFASNADTGAYYLTGAYRFWLAKNVDLYAGYVRLVNRRNATYRFGSGNFGAVPVGSTSQGFSLGMRYMF